MKLEQLVAPLWFAKKLPKDMETVFVWWTWNKGISKHLAFRKDWRKSDMMNAEMKGDEFYPAPTLQELRNTLVDKYDLAGLEFLEHAFYAEIESHFTGLGWKYLDSLLFTKV